MEEKKDKKLGKYMDRFARELVKLPVEEYLGLLTICVIKLYRDEDKEDTKSAAELFEELIDKVATYPRIKRRNLLMIMKKAN